MFIRDNQVFDVYAFQTIGETQYPVGWFLDAGRRAAAQVYEVHHVPPPEIGGNQKLVSDGFSLDDEGRWVQDWLIQMKTGDELDADAAALADAKVAKNNEINAWRVEANRTTFPFNGKHIACDELSMKDILVVAGYVGMFGAFNPSFPGAWKYTDNTYVVMEHIDDFKAMFHAMAEQGSLNFQNSQDLKTALAVATTLEQVAAITW